MTKKATAYAWKALITLALLSLLWRLGPPRTKLTEHLFNKETSMKSGAEKIQEDLHYFIVRPDQRPIGLSLLEAERYSGAVIAQQLIGNLVYYSNHGRYEPRIAQSWENPDPTTWKFRLRPGFTCENGEVITPTSFRLSLLRAIRLQEKKGGSLVFQRLNGFKEFVENGKDLTGISSTADELTFSFSAPIKDGLLETLSYAPYGYICADNFSAEDPDTWKDNSKFISSGPYQVEAFELGQKVILKKRKVWNRPFGEHSPNRVEIRFKQQEDNQYPKHSIVDVSARKPDELNPALEMYKLVPEYLSALVLGNLKNGYFADQNNRQAFREDNS
ncbi:MAG: hypothetical protein EOO18_08255 [Chryseobacterium sp.]|nr:MAG: hypothetical protein EOO18_08255 [Chryseobacterium sp.]